MQEKIAKHALKLLEKKGADSIVIHVYESNDTQSKFTKSMVNNSLSSISSGVGIFACFGKKIIETSTDDTSLKGVESLAKESAKFAKFAKDNNDFYGIAKGPRKYLQNNSLYDKSMSRVSHADVVKEAIDTAKGLGVERNDGTLNTDIKSMYLLSSEGMEGWFKSTSAYFSIRCLLDKYATGQDMTVSTTLKGLRHMRAAESAAQTALDARNPKKGIHGKFDIIFSPVAAANIVERIGHAASIFDVEAGFSFLAGKKNKAVASEGVSIYDNGTIRGGLGSAPFDHEGSPTQKTAVIKKGVLKNFLHNHSTAAKYKKKTTGNAGILAPHPSNIVLEKGRAKHENLISMVKKGILITNLWYTRFQNHQTGDFSTIPRDGIFYIKDGRIAYPIKEIRVSDNMLSMMKNITAIASNQKQIMGWEVETPVFTPSILVKGVRITRPEIKKE